MIKSTLIKAIATMAFFVFATCSKQQASEIEADGTTAIVNVNLISMQDEKVRPAQTVIVKDGKIAKIMEGTRAPEGAMVIDGGGYYLVPGLAEMHAHIPVPRNGDRSLVDETLFLYLSNGITTIRGMLGNPFHIQLREEVAEGKTLGPRIYTSGPSLNGNSSPTPEVAAQMIRDQKEMGYDFLKMHPGLSLETFNEIDKVADELGMVYSGHVSIDVGIRRALEAKYGSIDHLDGYVEGLVPESINVNPASGGFFGINFTDLGELELLESLVSATKAQGVWIVPTQSLMERWAGPVDPEVIGNEPEMSYMDPGTRGRWIASVKQFQEAEDFSKDKATRFIELRRTILKRLHEAGVGFLLGSDAPQIFNVPGFSIQHEMQSMIRCGISPYETLKSGTVNPADFFEAKGQFGVIAQGASADMILVRGNPLEDISFMEKPKGVMVKGTWLSENDIENRLNEIKKKYETDGKE